MKKTTLAIAALSLSLSSYGQRMGVATSNWSGLNSVYLNPANIADSRAGFVLDLFSLNAGMDNDLIKLKLSEIANPTANGTGINLSKGGNINMILPFVEMRLPAVMLAVKKNSFAISTRFRFINQFNNFDRRIIGMVTDPNSTSTSGTINMIANDFNWTTHAWSELRFTYAREVYSKGDHFLKAGITASRLGGVGFFGLRGSVNGSFDPANMSLTATNTDISIGGSPRSAITDIIGGNVSDFVSAALGGKTGNGWGFDLGAVYEYRPNGGGDDAGDPACNKYKVRGSVALTDIGSVKYGEAVGARITANGTMSATDIASNVGNYSDFSSYAASRNFKLDSGVTSTKIKLPTSLVLGADYYVASHFYVNATYFMNMVNRAASFGNSIYNQVTITPRWDTKMFSVGVPVSVNAMSGFKAGLGLRLGGFIMGSDDFYGLLTTATGVNVYFGGYVPIHKRHKKGGSSTVDAKTTDQSAPAPAAPKTN